MMEEEVLDKKNEASNFMDEIPDVRAHKIQNDENFTVQLVDKDLKKSLKNTGMEHQTGRQNFC